MIKIGLDLSINSTGIVIDDGKDIKYYIITSKSTKKLKSWNDPRINIIIYDKTNNEKDIKYSEKERIKSNNIISIVNIIKDILEPYKNNAIAFIEGISYGSVGSSAIADLSGLNFMVRYILYLLNIDFIIVSPMENKKQACGIGNADKDIMIYSWLKCQPKMEGTQNIIKVDDIADAYFLSQTEKY